MSVPSAFAKADAMLAALAVPVPTGRELRPSAARDSLGSDLQ